VDAPPLIPSDAPPVQPAGAFRRPIARWRTWLALLLLAPYPVLLGIILPWLLEKFTGATSPQDGPALPENVRGLLLLSLETLLIFGLLAAVCWALARPSSDQLRLSRRPGWRDWLLAFAYSWAARFLAASPLIAVVFWKIFQGEDVADVLGLRAKVENVVGFEPLMNPLYLFLTVTLISFVVAGLREELWRAGVIALGETLLPAAWSTRRRAGVLITGSAVIFGLGHLPQGITGVLQTGFIGVCFGIIIVYHRSTWLAVLSHGMLNAITFGLMRLVKESGELEKFLGK